MVPFFWDPFLFIIDPKGTCSFIWFTVVIRVLSLNWAISLISWKKFCKSEDNWFLVYLFEAGMKLRFLFRNLYVSKENECFDQFTASPNGLDLYLSVFVIVRCSLKVFALFLERNSVSSTDRCWFEYGLLMWRPSDFQLEMFFLILSVFSLLCVSCSFCFVSKIYDSLDLHFLSLSFDVCFVLEGTFVGDFPRRCYVWIGCSNSSFFKRVGGSSWIFVSLVFLKCWTFGLMMLVFPWTTFA